MTRVLCLAGVLVALLCGPAPAATVVDLGRGPGGITAPAPTLVGPTPAGTGMAYVFGTPATGFSVGVAPAAGARREIGRVARSIDPSIALASSSGLVAVSWIDVDCREEFACHYEPVIVGDALVAGPLSGPLAAICGSACAPSYACVGRHMSAASAALLVQDACNGAATLIDSRGARQLGVRRAAVSDTSLATATDTGPVTVARPDGTPRYTAPAVRNLSGIALDAAGALAQFDGRTLSISTAAQPTPRAVLSFGEIGGTLLGGGAQRFALAKPRGHGSRVFVVGEDGATTAPVDLPSAVLDVAFDGQRLTYGVRTCAATRLVSLPIGETPPAVPRCTAPVLRTRSATVARSGAMTLRFACPPSAPAGCAGALTATARRPRIGRRENGAARYYRLADLSLRMNPGESGAARAVLAPGARRWARAHRRGLAVVVTAGGRTTRIPLRFSR